MDLFLFPPEITALIVHFLPPKGRKGLLLLNKWWNIHGSEYVIDAVLQHSLVTFTNESRQIKCIQATTQDQSAEIINSLFVLKKIESLEGLCFCGVDKQSKLEYLAQFPSLTYLGLKYCKFTDVKSSKSLSKLADLKHLDLSSTKNLALDWVTTRLETLLLSYWGYTSDYFTPLSHLRSLKKLYMTECCMFEDKCIKHITHLTALESLTIHRCSTSPHGFKELCANITTLTRLVYLEEELTKNALSYITSLISLQSLDIFVTKGGLECISFLTNLTKLCVHNVEGSISADISSFNALKRLQQFSIRLDDQYDIELTLKAISTLEQLNYLCLDNCQQMQAEYLHYIAVLSQLTQLQLGCPISLTNDSFGYIASLTNLQILKFSRCPLLNPSVIKQYWTQCCIEREERIIIDPSFY